MYDDLLLVSSRRLNKKNFSNHNYSNYKHCQKDPNNFRPYRLDIRAIHNIFRVNFNPLTDSSNEHNSSVVIRPAELHRTNIEAKAHTVKGLTHLSALGRIAITYRKMFDDSKYTL